MIKRSHFIIFLLLVCIGIILIDHVSRFPPKNYQYASPALPFTKEIVLPEKTFVKNPFGEGFAYLKRKSIYNPCVCKVSDGYLMLYRMRKIYHCFPSFNLLKWHKIKHPGHMSTFLYGVFLNDSFEPISSEILLEPKSPEGDEIIAEDPRFIEYNGSLYCLYVDQHFIDGKFYNQMYISEVTVENHDITLSTAIRLNHPITPQRREKNWMPFIRGEKLHIIYNSDPLEVLSLNPRSGELTVEPSIAKDLPWAHGFISGSTPAIQVSEEYLTFIHSYQTSSKLLWKDKTTNFYLFGAYAMKGSPPFEITKYTPLPLMIPHLYSQAVNRYKFVFPSALIKESENSCLLFTGVNDEKILVTRIDTDALMKQLSPLP